ANTLRREVQAIDKDQPVYSVRTFDDVMMNSLGTRRVSMQLFTVFAIAALILRQGMSLALAGSVLGLVASFFLTRLIRGLLYGVETSDPTIYAAILLLLILVAFIACYLPARRAAKLNPVT